VNATPQNLPATGGTTEVRARVEDPSGNALPGVLVNFSSDFGSLAATTATTDAQGVATTRLTSTRASIITVRAAGKEATINIGLTERSGIAVTPPTTPPSAGQPTTIGVSVTGTANVQDVLIDFGDRRQASLGRLNGSTNISHTYAEAGTYTITATALLGDGSRETVSSPITVLPQRPLAVSLSASPGCAVKGTTRVTFTASTSGGSPTGYFWNFGTGEPDVFSTGPTIQFTYPTTAPNGQTPVTVRVTALDAADGVGQTTITVAPSGGC
jgi:adhesin/invasin